MTLAGLAIRDRDAPLWAMAASAAALAAALAAQHLGGLPPCELCLWQRLPYGVAAAAGLGALLWFRSRRERAALTWLAALCFAAVAAVAAWHVLVEQGLAAGPGTCSGADALERAATAAELERLLEAAPVVRCDVVPWSLFGLSIAGWNMLYAAGLAAFCCAAGRRLARSAAP